MTAQPISHCSDCISRLVGVCSNVLPCNIRTEISISVTFAIEHQTLFLPVAFRPVPFRSEEEAQFERHVESRQLRVPVDSGTGDIVNPELRLLDQRQDLLDACLSAIGDLECRPRDKTAVMDCKDNGIAEPHIFGIKGNVDEDAIVVGRHASQRLFTDAVDSFACRFSTINLPVTASRYTRRAAAFAAAGVTRL